MDTQFEETSRAEAGGNAPSGHDNFLFIGELAKLTATDPKTIRFYERAELLSPPRHGRFRTYLASDVRRLKNVLLLRKLGVPIAQIRQMFDMIGGDADIHVSTHAEGGTVIIKGNAKGRVGGQMVKGNIYVFGKIENPLPGFQHIGEVEEEVDGTKARFIHCIGDLGERHPVSRGRPVYGNIYTRI